ncbi:MAG: nucleotidyltransferase domain-containing protein [Spirochaetes bacterium]|nr:nucleotidyltransferase domain-containing protein [Spirochaetota bacterium]
MDKREALKKATRYINGIESIVRLKRAYVFGSHVAGNAREESDIDVGIIVEGLDDEYFTVLKNLYRARRDIDSRIEPHLFILGRPSSGFLETVEKEGERIF